MEGRQAEIIAHCVHGDLAKARVLLAQSTTSEPWEQEVAACLQMMCTEPSDVLIGPIVTMSTVAAAVARYAGRPRTVGYASYNARLGLTIAALANTVSPAWRRNCSDWSPTTRSVQQTGTPHATCSASASPSTASQTTSAATSAASPRSQVLASGRCHRRSCDG